MTTLLTSARREVITLYDAAQEFSKHASPWLQSTVLVAALGARLIVGDWQVTDALLPLCLIVILPVAEWIVHAFLLHWRPRRIGRLTVDSLMAREHRRHHADPRNVELIFIPWKSLLWLIPVTALITLLAFPRPGLGLTCLVGSITIGLAYEWMHYLVHSRYQPKSRLYKAIWRNHRQHHYKNEKYWFNITNCGVADRILGTFRDPVAVPTSPTAESLHRPQHRPSSSVVIREPS